MRGVELGDSQLEAQTRTDPLAEPTGSQQSFIEGMRERNDGEGDLQIPVKEEAGGYLLCGRRHRRPLLAYRQHGTGREQFMSLCMQGESFFCHCIGPQCHVGVQLE